VNKIFLILFIFGFFLDFSFIPSLFGSNYSWPYSITSLIIASLLFNDNAQKIFWGTIGVILLNIIMPFSLLIYGLIILSIWLMIYFLENIFLNKEFSYLKSNIIFIISFIIFNFLLFSGEYLKNKLFENESIIFYMPGFFNLTIKLLIGLLVFNLIYKVLHKLCVKDIKALK